MFRVRRGLFVVSLEWVVVVLLCVVMLLLLLLLLVLVAQLMAKPILPPFAVSGKKGGESPAGN
jgi:hypothetical protein